MINIATKTGCYLRATSQVVGTGLRPLAAGVVEPKKLVVAQKSKKVSVYGLNSPLPAGNLSVRSGVGGKLTWWRSRSIASFTKFVSLARNFQYYVIYFDPSQLRFTNSALFTVSTQIRMAHTDIQVPDFTPYRRDSTKRAASARNANDDEDRKSFTYLLVGG